MLFEHYVHFHILNYGPVTEWPPIEIYTCSLGLRYVL